MFVTLECICSSARAFVSCLVALLQKMPMKRKKPIARMSQENRALCWALRHPPRGEKIKKYWQIQEVIEKKDGETPCISALADAAHTFKNKN